MLYINKINIIFYNQSFIYFLQLYKIISLFIINSLKKKEIWSWPILNNSVKFDFYLSFF